jgi:hypothetical protein
MGPSALLHPAGAAILAVTGGGGSHDKDTHRPRVRSAQRTAQRFGHSSRCGVPEDLGYRRGGFYTYDLLDNAGERSADHILDEYQDIHVGDSIPMFHETRSGLAIAYEVDSLEPPNWML